MVDRIREILSRYQLTPTQFADAIGTARPIVSHILSGRNKPSLEVVQKIVAAFPDLSLPWLLSGTGPVQSGTATAPSPYIEAEQPTLLPSATEKPSTARISTKRSSTISQGSQGVAEALRPAVAPTMPAKGGQMASKHTESTAPTPSLAEAPVPAPTVAPVSAPAVTEITAPSEVAPTAMATSLQGIAEPGKLIRRIVIFYSDGTFSDYQPEIR
jgi:transcriptional regulator with XRE-family HTH domain